jgi:hypothetical protein
MCDRRRILAMTFPLLLVPLVLAACGSGGDDDDTAATEPPGPTSTSTSAEPGATRTDGDVLVELATSGGEDGRGIGDLVVTPDGDVRFEDRQGGIETVRLDAGELDDLVTTLEDADFAGAPTEPDVDDVCPDALVSRVTYGEWEVTADTCTVPDEVAPVFDALEGILARFG